jgi:hypothetical protein
VSHIFPVFQRRLALETPAVLEKLNLVDVFGVIDGRGNGGVLMVCTRKDGSQWKWCDIFVVISNLDDLSVGKRGG